MGRVKTIERQFLEKYVPELKSFEPAKIARCIRQFQRSLNSENSPTLTERSFRCEREGCNQIIHSRDLTFFPEHWCQTGESRFADALGGIAAWCPNHWPDLPGEDGDLR